LLAELSAAGRLPAIPSESHDGRPITYHDPCYLARANGVTAEPRAVLAAAANVRGELPVLELPRNREHTSCCGGGGGRMWFDDPPAQRVGQSRVTEIMASGAGAVAVSCPFCMIMLADGLAARQSNIRVRDIADLLAEATLGPEEAATPRE
jgi:Fe-S oxidoreductase